MRPDCRTVERARSALPGTWAVNPCRAGGTPQPLLPRGPAAVVGGVVVDGPAAAGCDACDEEHPSVAVSSVMPMAVAASDPRPGGTGRHRQQRLEAVEAELRVVLDHLGAGHMAVAQPPARELFADAADHLRHGGHLVRRHILSCPSLDGAGDTEVWTAAGRLACRGHPSTGQRFPHRGRPNARVTLHDREPRVRGGLQHLARASRPAIAVRYSSSRRTLARSTQARYTPSFDP